MHLTAVLHIESVYNYIGHKTSDGNHKIPISLTSWKQRLKIKREFLIEKNNSNSIRRDPRTINGLQS